MVLQVENYELCLTNVPFTFATLIKENFKGLIMKCVAIYLYNIIVLIKTREKRAKHLHQKLESLRKH